MPKITIEGQEYDLDTLSDEAKNHLGSVRFVSAEIQRLKAHLAALQTASNTYVAALKKAVEGQATAVTKN